MENSEPMSVGISFQEFEQLQQQIVNLRTENYDLQSKQTKYTKELYELREKIDALLTENQRLNQILSRDKNGLTYDRILKENERLQQQEGDFQLQCKTLIQEISQLTDDNELLRNSVKQYQKMVEDLDITPDELTTMKRELAALREECAHSRSRHTSEILIEENGHVGNISKENENSEAISSQFEMFTSNFQNEKRVLLDNLNDCKTKINDLEREVDIVNGIIAEQKDKYQKLMEENDTLTVEIDSLKEKCTSLEKLVLKSQQTECALQKLEADNKKATEQHENDISKWNNEKSSWISKFDCLTLEKQEMESDILTLKQGIVNAKETISSTTEELQSVKSKASVLEEKFTESRVLVEELTRQISEVNAEKKALSSESQQLSKQYSELTSEHQNLSKSFQILEQNLEDEKSAYEAIQAKLSEVTIDSENLKKQLDSGNENYITMKSEFERSCSEKSMQLEELRNEIQIIRQNAQEEVSVIRRKDGAIVKDLQRQLKAERRRVEKLQHSLDQVTKQSSVEISTSNVGEIAESKSIDNEFDTSSVSSFSLSNFKNAILSRTFSSSGTPGSVIHSSTPSHSLNAPTGQLPGYETVVDLASQIQKLNLENDRLHEKISYLEGSSSALADDVLKKQQLIDHYLMADRERSQTVSPGVSMNSGLGNSLNSTPHRNFLESPTPIQTFKSLLEKVSNGGTSSKAVTAAEEMRLKRGMEEILTKNMILEETIQHLSEENSRLRASSTSTTSTVTH